ncbi:hypothetical protein HF325_005160 [Metschnikowia pulcherrima]|uniref:Uncharacterized protein n=1 Tax=Metschnikowia pulcherrima TaxID=27326 RepID=A0A8H7GPP6_9ASCO|nr:hypothetical protein HF325_005160 [Metschnikowia pulcherrima]
MNQVSSFLENIIAVEDSQNPVPARPLSEQARRPSLASMEIPVLDNPDSDTDSDAETAEADSPRIRWSHIRAKWPISGTLKMIRRRCRTN